MSVYAPATDYLWELIRSYGIDPEPVFTAAGVDPRLRFDPAARLPRERMNALHAAAWRATGDIALGLRVERAFRPAHMGALGYAWLASPDLRSAWGKIERYSRLEAESFRLSLEEQGGRALIRYTWDGDWTPIPPQTYEVMALLVYLCRLVVGQDCDPSEVAFATPLPDDPARFDAYFRCEVHFERPEDLLVLPRSLLDRPLTGAHPELEQATDELVLRYLAQRERDDIVSQLRAALFELLPEGRIGAEEVAARLNLSVRTLRRRLDAEGLSFRDFVSQVRHELAARYIRDESLTLTEISYLLGFSEPSSFSRAFRGWTGQSPSAARSGSRA